MTLEDVASFCQLKDCFVELGDPAVGLIRVDAHGLVLNRYTYGRFMLFDETSALPSPSAVLAEASIFRVCRRENVELMDRQEFEKQLDRVRKLTA